jgi:uncharacterized protein
MKAFPRLCLFARYPTPGAAKTRLIPAIGADGAADVHRTLTERTVATLSGQGCAVEVHITGDVPERFSDWLGNDMAFIPQVDGDLTARLMAALDPAPVIFFGADTPDLSREIVADAIAALATHDVVIGPAEDGGYYLIGMVRGFPDLLTGIDWSTERVFAQTIAKADAANLLVKVLETLSDCDRPEDLARWPWLTG